jgi:hypothetical protein
MVTHHLNKIPVRVAMGPSEHFISSLPLVGPPNYAFFGPPTDNVVAGLRRQYRTFELFSLPL